MLLVPLIPTQIQLHAHAKLVIQMQVLVQASCVKVKIILNFELIRSNDYKSLIEFISDSCQVNNGDCDSNAICSFDRTANRVKCTCKTGYSNTGTGSSVVCTGKTSYLQ